MWQQQNISCLLCLSKEKNYIQQVWKIIDLSFLWGENCVFIFTLEFSKTQVYKNWEIKKKQYQ